ncbi:MAG TPA: tetratricopeptide repeat protein, partial [Terriglobales bacterium]|nr:tetratricopeptide repeat protein [Terriglobales bacterium]
VLPPGTLSNEKARQRFRREALALAKLNHPNVGAVYEFGSDAGVDFLVMELVSGVTLDAKLNGGALSESETARFGSQLADGLAAAHSQGIVHRDLKPGNLRLTSDGRLKILDFGLAETQEASDPTAVTATLTRTESEISGTVPYMAPELLRGHRADARSDIYACGAVLYEMATGKRPYPGVSGPQLVGAILEREPSAPSAVNQRVSRGLESIVLKALDKDPERRYQSARELKIDLERLQSGSVPVAARPRGRWKWGVVLAAVAAAALAAFIVGGWRSRFWGHNTPVPTPTAAAKARRSVAVLGFKNLSGRSDEAWISTALAEMLTTELASGEQLRTIPGENVARMKLDLSLAEADSFAPDTLQRIHNNLGTDLVVLGSYLAMGKEGGSKIRLDFRLQDAVAGETIATVSETSTENDLIGLVARTGATLRQKIGIADVSPSDASVVRAALPSNPEATRLYSEGLDKLRVFEALAARDLLTQAVKIDPSHALSHSALAEAWSALGYDARAQEEAKKAFDLSSGLSRENRLAVEGRLREATHQWPEAVEIYGTLWRFFPDNVEYGLRLASAQISAGAGKDVLATVNGLQQSNGGAGDARIDLMESKAAMALGDFNKAQRTAANAAAKGRAQGSRLVVAQSRAAEGRAWERLGKSDDAKAAFREAVDLFTAAGDKVGAASAVSANGNVLYDLGDFAGARKAYEDSLAVFQELGAKQRASSALNNIGNVYYDQGDLEKARTYYQQSLAIYRETEDKQGAAGALGNIANVLDSLGDLQGALKMQEEGLAAFREVGDKRGTGSTLGNFGNLLAEMGDLPGAEAKYQEALEIHRASGYQRGVAFILFGLSDVRTAQGRLAEARDFAEKAAKIRRDMKEKSTLGQSNLQLAFLDLEDGRAAGAESLAKSAAEEFDSDKAADNGASAYSVLALTQLAQNKLEEARTSATRAMSLSQQTKYKPPRFDAAVADGRVQAAAGDSAGALRMLEGVRTEAVKYGYVPYDFEVRLAMGEIEMKAGTTASGRARLAQLEKDARQKGYLRIAEKAKGAL